MAQTTHRTVSAMYDALLTANMFLQNLTTEDFRIGGDRPAREAITSALIAFEAERREPRECYFDHFFMWSDVRTKQAYTQSRHTWQIDKIEQCYVHMMARWNALDQ